MPASPSTTVGIGERIVSGGSATNNARKASATPAQPTVRPVSQPSPLGGLGGRRLPRGGDGHAGAASVGGGARAGAASPRSRHR